MSYSCGICFSEYSVDERSPCAPRILRCGHTFCSDCLIKILETTHKLVCPKCRSNVTDMKEIPLNKALIQLIKRAQEKRLQEQQSKVRALPAAIEGEDNENGDEKKKEKSSKPFKCLFPGCKEVFTSKEGLSKHIKDKGHARSSNYKGYMKDGKYQHQCEFKCCYPNCNETFSSREDLQKHVCAKGHICIIRK